MKEVEFLKDYASKKKGDTMLLDGMVVSSLLKQKIVKLKIGKTVNKSVKAKKTDK
jgi:hypothetical protein